MQRRPAFWAAIAGGAVVGVAAWGTFKMSGEPSPWLLALAIVVLAFALWRLFIPQAPAPAPTPPRTGINVQDGGSADIRGSRFGKDLTTGIEVAGDATIENTQHD